MTVALASGAANAAARAIEDVGTAVGPHFGLLVMDDSTHTGGDLASNIVVFDSKATELLQILQTFGNFSRQFISEEVKLLHFCQISKALGDRAAKFVGIHEKSLKINEFAQVCWNCALEVVFGQMEACKRSAHQADALGDGSSESVGTQKCNRFW